MGRYKFIDDENYLAEVDFVEECERLGETDSVAYKLSVRHLE